MTDGTFMSDPTSDTTASGVVLWSYTGLVSNNVMESGVVTVSKFVTGTVVVIGMDVVTGTVDVIGMEVVTGTVDVIGMEVVTGTVDVIGMEVVIGRDVVTGREVVTISGTNVVIERVVAASAVLCIVLAVAVNIKHKLCTVID